MRLVFGRGSSCPSWALSTSLSVLVGSTLTAGLTLDLTDPSKPTPDPALDTLPIGQSFG